MTKYLNFAIRPNDTRLVILDEKVTKKFTREKYFLREIKTNCVYYFEAKKNEIKIRFSFEDCLDKSRK